MYNNYVPAMPYSADYYRNGYEDERFFPLILPFVAGLAIGPLLFNRPNYGPYYPPPYYSTPYPPYQGYQGYPGYPGIAGYPSMTTPMGAQAAVSENINIYNTRT